MPTFSPSIACVLLAAGESSRYGGCKLLETLNGETVIQRVIATVLNSSCDSNPIHHVCIVTGAYGETLQTHIQTINANNVISVVHCADWREGMGTSLAFGVKCLPPSDAILVALGDQVLVNTDDLQKLGTAWSVSPTKIICARYNGTLGVPAVFPNRYRKQLEALNGQAGAKKLLNENSGIEAVEISNAAFDIDTRDDFQQFRRLLAGQSSHQQPQE